MLLARHFLADQSILRHAEAPAAPRTSVVLPVAVGCSPRRLQQTLESLLTPTGNLELILVEDGVDPGIRAAIDPLLAGEPRLVVIRHERGQGLLAIRANEGIEQSRGERILVLDRADPIEPTALARAIERTRFDESGLADPHLVLADVWLEDLHERLGSAARHCDDCLPRRLFRDTVRTERLKPAVWREASVEELRGVNEPNAITRRALYERFVRPFLLRNRHRLGVERFPLNLQDEPHDVAILRYGRDGGDHISFYNFDGPMRERGTYRFHAHPPMPVQDTPIRADVLVTFRSFVTPHGDQIVQKAARAGLPMACYLDDDLINLHEIPAFSYMKPGKPSYNSMIRQAQAADVVWITNDYLASVYRPINPRLVPHMGCIRPELLPARPFARKADEPITVAYCGAAYRVEEFRVIWTALQRIAKEHAGKVRFAFWGLNPAELPPLDAPTSFEPFSVGYEEYLTRLTRAQFDIFITPLFEEPRCRLGKSLIKYYELALSGAIGVFSDVYQYDPLADGETLLKTPNDPDSWFAALDRAVTMPEAEREAMRVRCLEHVRETYTSTAQVHLVEAGCRATEVHAATRSARHEDGRPRLLLMTRAGFAGAKTWLRRRDLLPRYGIEPVVMEQATEARAVDLITLIQSVRPFLVESLGHDARLAEACRTAGVPYLPTTDGSPEGVALVLTSAAEASTSAMRSFCFRGMASAKAFEIGTVRLRFEKDATLVRSLERLGRPVRVVAVGPEAVVRSALDRTPLPAGWDLTSVAEDVVDPELLHQADLLLLAEHHGELSGWMLDAMAAGVLVLTPSGRAVSDVILDGETGVVGSLSESLRRAVSLPGTVRKQMLMAARRVAREEFHAERAASELMLAYSLLCCPQPRRNFVRLNQNGGGTIARYSSVPTLPAESGSIVRVEQFNTRLRYEILPGESNWSGLDMTVYAENLVDPVPVHLELIDATGNVIRTSSADVQPGVSYQLLTFRFPPIAKPGRKPFQVRLTPTPVPRPGALRIFEFVPGKRTVFERAFRKYLRFFTRKGLTCRLIHTRAG